MVIALNDARTSDHEGHLNDRCSQSEQVGKEDKAPTRQIDESVTNTIEIRQMQQAEFVTSVYRKCSRHQGVPPGDEVGASRPCVAMCEQADDPGEGFSSLVRARWRTLLETSTKRRKL